MRSWKNRILLFCVLISLVKPIRAYCTEEVQTSGEQFKVRLVADPQTFDWNLATSAMETPILMNVMEGLASFDSHMNPKPALAKSWTISEDQKTFTFKIREGVKWSDGKTLTAQDFVDSWERLLNPLTGAPYAYILFDVEGAEDYNAKKNTDFSKVGIKALNPTTLEVKLRKPISFFVQMLTFWVTFPIRKDLIEKYGPSWSRPGKIAVLGPFIPVSYRPQAQIILKRNETYYGKKPELETVLMRIVNEDSTALNLYKSGKLDFIRPINFLELGELSKSPEFHNDVYYRTCYININTTKYPFNLPKVRKALSMAIDRSALPKVMHRAVREANSLLPPELFPEGRNTSPQFNPEKAKALLKEVGIEPKSFPTIELYSFASDENALLLQYLQEQIKKNLGLTVEIKLPEYKMYRTELELQTGSLYHRCWGADYADPDSFFGVFLSNSGNNRTGWKNSNYDSWVRRASSIPNGPERTKLYKDSLNLLLRDEAPVVTLYHDSLTYLLNPVFKNFSINPLNYVLFKDIVVAK